MKHGWEVEWCTNLPRLIVDGQDEGADVDHADYQVEDCESYEQAVEKAKSVLPIDAFGSVRIREFSTDKYGCRDYLSEETID